MNNNSWKYLGELTDKTVLGLEGMSLSKPRKTARAILVNEEGKYAVMFAEKFNLHTLPGGGFEDDETAREALIREVLEETGCTCDAIKPLGMVSENRCHADFTSLSYYFVVQTKGKNTKPDLTDAEIENGTCLKWCTLDEAIHLIKDCKHDTNQKRFLQARDVMALEEYCRTKLVL